MGVVSAAISAVVGVAQSGAAARGVPVPAQRLVGWLREHLTSTVELEQVLHAPHLIDGVLDLTNRLSAELSADDLDTVQGLLDRLREDHAGWWAHSTTRVARGSVADADAPPGPSWWGSVLTGLQAGGSVDAAGPHGWPPSTATPPQVDADAITEYVDYVGALRAQTHLGESPLRTVPGAVFVDLRREAAKRRNPCYLRAAWLPVTEPCLATALCVRRWEHRAWPVVANNILNATLWWSRFAPSTPAAFRPPATVTPSAAVWLPGPSRNRPPSEVVLRRTPGEWAMLAVHLIAAGVALYCCVKWAWMWSSLG